VIQKDFTYWTSEKVKHLSKKKWQLKVMQRGGRWGRANAVGKRLLGGKKGGEAFELVVRENPPFWEGKDVGRPLGGHFQTL